MVLVHLTFGALCYSCLCVLMKKCVLFPESFVYKQTITINLNYNETDIFYDDVFVGNTVYVCPKHGKSKN